MSKWKDLLLACFRSPILWGALASFGFYGLIRADVLSGDLIRLYFADHPVEYVATTMFFIALAVLVIKATEVYSQNARLGQSLLGPGPSSGHLKADCRAMLDRLDRRPRHRQAEYLVGRLREAIQHVQRRESAETLDEHLKYLADRDAGRLYSSYALVRVIIWAIPILGFLGTVIGITMAIANLDVAPGQMEGSLPEVISGLSVAFATTTQALVLSIVLMFAQYYTDQKESGLLGRVEDRATAELEGRFEHVPDTPDGQLTAVRRMAETVVEVTERLVQQQTELWQGSMDSAAGRWARMADSAGEQLQTSLCGALADSLKTHARQLGAAEQSAAQQNRLHWQQVQRTQAQQTQAMVSLQSALTRQVEVLGRAVEAAGEVARMEDTLNRNLAALAGAKNFEQTVLSLAATIQLLHLRLADGPAETSPVTLQPGKRPPQAA